MKGTVKTYLPEKKYGFIKGDDGKDYFFHASGFKNSDQVSKICEESVVEFDQQATPKGYKAKSCTLINPADVFTYVVPDEFITSKSSGVRGWEVMELSDWVVHGSSSHSPDAAKKEVIRRAKQIGANALIDVEYYKATGSASGSGSGVYHYTIHNFRGRAVMLGKRNSLGKYTVGDLTGVNQRAGGLKAHLVKKTKTNEMKRFGVWLGVLASALIALLQAPWLIIGIVIFAFLYSGNSMDYDHWLEKM